MRTLIATACILASSMALGAKSYSCKSNTSDEVRKIEVIEEITGQKVPCKVHYTLPNQTPQEKFNAKNDPSYCESGALKIKENLEKAQAFTCQELTM